MAQPRRLRRWSTVGAVVVGVAVAAVAAGTGRRTGAAVVRGHGGGVHRRARRHRNVEVARLSARTTRRWARHRARRTFAGAARRDALDTRFQLETAADVAAALGNLKGAFMKLGQMASYLDLGLPEPTREILAQLQADAPPMSPALAAGMVHDELGAAPDLLFAEWDPVPIAAASIGQVHRAITRDGRAVAVKVQYPGIDEAVGADLANTDLVFGALRTAFPGLDTEPIVAELRARLLEELDYRVEADNQRLFSAYYDGHPTIHVPSVVDALSTRRVLTTELATGARFDESVGWSKHQRDLAAETLYRFSFGSIYRLHAFNGDPHPGNYLFGPGGRVTFLDFGLVKRFTPEETILFQRLIRAMVVERDIPGFRREIERAGLLAPGSPFPDEQIGSYFSHFYDFVLRDGPVTFERDYAAAGVRQVFQTSGPDAELVKALNVPPSFVILQRINLGLISLFARLGATGNWRRIAEELWPFVDGPPSTPMGEQIRAWELERRHRGT